MTHQRLGLGEWDAGLGASNPTMKPEGSGLGLDKQLQSKVSPKPTSKKICRGHVK